MSGDDKSEETPLVNQAPPAPEPEIVAVPEIEPPVNSGAAAERHRVPSAEEFERDIADRERAADHRFRKGISGNPRGRPRKVERSYTPRQQRRDVLRIAESPTTIRTAKSKKKVPIIEAIILLTAAKALAGHGPSANRMMKWYTDAINKHTEAHAQKFEILELSEITAALTLDEMTEYWNEYLNRMRRLTRRT
jgi:hypothetical protein